MFEWNARYNLTAIRNPDEALRRHVAESLEAVALLDASAGDRLVDLGSGNGYPAVPLLTARPGLAGLLVEARDAKAAFLRAVLRETGLSDRVAVDQRRLAGPEEIPDDATIVTLRAFPDAPTWIAGILDHPSVRLVLAWLTPRDAQAIAAASRAAGHTTDVLPLRANPAGAVLRVTSRYKTD